MRPRPFRAVLWGPAVFAATALFAFAVAPVHASPPPQANPSWGDIYSVTAGPGLLGGATEGDATLSVAFGGNGVADTVARSDHNHDARYMLKGESAGNLDDRYWLRTENFDDRYAPLGHNHDALYAALNHTHDDLYAPLAHNHDGLYLGLGGGTLNGFLTLALGDLTLLGDGARVVAPQLVSTAPDGTAPLQVGSSALVTNLNADKLDGYDASDFVLAGSGGGSCTDCALLTGSNAFTAVNTFNAPTTFGGPVGLSAGAASFTFQPFYTSTSAYSLRLMDSRVNATRLVVDQNGRIGIGTTLPSVPLHVVGDIRGTNLVASGTVTAAGYNITTGGISPRAGTGAIPEGATASTIATTAVGASSLIFVTPDASRSGCVASPGFLYVSARAAGSSFTTTVAGPAPGAGASYCFNWWVVN